MNDYGPDFFAKHHAGAERSAQRVLPHVVELLDPRSVVDVGCGSGAWLAEAARLGVEDYLGVDGFTPDASLAIPRERFATHDLTAPLRLDRRFDLALCLEVGEHLPERAADVLVESLAGLAPAVLFSAAVPGQGGDNHVNESWPDYWVERFAARGYIAVDAIRPLVWGADEVAWWYRQNLLLMCERELVAGSRALREAHEATRPGQLAVVHPHLYLSRTAERDRLREERDRLAAELERPRALREALGELPRAAGAAVRRRARRSR
jgi:SAM-dependent methyltransferase